MSQNCLYGYYGVDGLTTIKGSDVWETYFPKNTSTNKNYRKVSGVAIVKPGSTYAKEVTEIDGKEEGYLVEACRSRPQELGINTTFDMLKDALLMRLSISLFTLLISLLLKRIDQTFLT